MEDGIEKKLDQLFEAHNRKSLQQQQAASEKERQEKEFLENFSKKVAEIYRPTFQNFADLVSARGINCRIEENEERAHTVREPHRQASIAIYFVLGGGGRNQLTECPHLSITCDKYSKAIHLRKSTMAPGRGGMSGPLGTFGLEDVNGPYLQQALLEILQQVLL